MRIDLVNAFADRWAAERRYLPEGPLASRILAKVAALRARRLGRGTTSLLRCGHPPAHKFVSVLGAKRRSQYRYVHHYYPQNDDLRPVSREVADDLAILFNAPER